jgi:putative ABC transport system permease protein
MIRPRWRKILRDIWRNKRRTVLVVLSIAVGVFAVGTVAIMRDIVTNGMATSYEAANPPNAILYVDGSFGDAQVEAIKRLPQVAEVEGRRQIVVRFQHPQSETWYPMTLYAVPDYENMRIGILQREEVFGPDPVRWPGPSVYPPPDRQILIERTSQLPGVPMGLTPNARQGDTISVETPSGAIRKVPLVGMVYDSVHGSAPWAGGAYGYVTLDTMEWLGYPRTYNQLLLRVTGDRYDVGHIDEVAATVEHQLNRSGLEVTRVDIPTPGKLPQDALYQGLVVLLAALGVVSLLLSVLLLVNTISALLAQQTRQIGVMKAIGARTAQIARLYLGMVVVFGVAAFAIAAPLAAWAGRYIINLMAYLLDFNLPEFSVSPPVLLFEAALAILVPLGAGLIPILSGCGVTVREAITSYGVSASEFGRSWLDRFVKSLSGLPAPLALSVRNTFRNKGRLLLTLFTLALAGAAFVAVMNVRTSLRRTVDDVFQYLACDFQVGLNQDYRLSLLEPLATSVPGVARVEGWGGAGGYRIRPDGSDGTDIGIAAPPADSKMVNPTLVAGRWLAPGDENALVVSANFLKEEPDLKVGDELVLEISGDETTWQIVGVMRWAMPQSIGYTNYEYLAPRFGAPGRVSSLYVATDRHDAASRVEIAKALEARLAEAGLNVSYVQTVDQMRSSAGTLFSIVTSLLMSMAVLLAIVGGIGLAGTMSLNVLERIREVAILRAIGAGHGAVLQVVIVEGVLIGVLSWGVAVLLAYPLGKMIGQIVGKVTMNITLTYIVSMTGVLLWLGLVIVISAVASYSPARQAANLSVRQVLAYEQ